MPRDRRDRTKVNPKGWTRFRTTALAIAPSLCGEIHAFTQSDRTVEVRLPKRPRKPRGAEVYGNDRISVVVYRQNGGICWFGVGSVDVVVTLPHSVSIPTIALDGANCTNFGKAESERLNVIAREAWRVGFAAYNRWVRMLRWKGLMGAISQPEIGTMESGWTQYLMDSIGEREFYAHPHVSRLGPLCRVSKRLWNKVGAALAADVEPPVYFNFLFEGEHRIANRDLHGGIVCLAIACESLLRSAFADLTNVKNEEVSQLIHRGINVSSLVDRWWKLGFSGKGWRTAFDRQQIKRLFELRNAVMHRGDARSLDLEECRRIAEAARTLVIFGDRKLSQKK